MYYFYKTMTTEGPFLHKTKRKEIADANCIIAECETLEESQDIYVQLIQDGNYINKRTGLKAIHARECKGKGSGGYNYKTIRCVETGQVWHSMTDLAYELGVTKQAVSNAVKNNIQMKKSGYHYELVEE